MGGQHSAANTTPGKAGGSLASMAKPLAVAALVMVSCWISIHTRQPGSLSTLWIASGILAGILMTSPRDAWRACVLAAFAGNLLVRAAQGDAWYSALGLAFASTLDAYLVALVLIRYVGDVTNPAHVGRVAVVAGVSAIGACALSAAIAASVHSAFGASPFGRVFATWFASHGLGMVIFATLTVVARAQGRRLLGRPGHRIEFACTILLIAAVSFAVFHQSRYPALFLVYPPLLLGTFRHRFSGVVFGVAAVAIIAIAETLSGNGPFYLIPHAATSERVILLQIFIASTCLLSLPVAVVLTGRSFLARRLRESELRYRMLADYSRDLIMRIGENGERLYTSPSAKEILGWEIEELRAPRWDLVHPDDVAQVMRAMADLRKAGGMTTVTYRVRHKDGRYVWLEAHARLVPSIESDGSPDIFCTGRDVTHRIDAERALAENQRRLHAITDNLPAFVLHVDGNEIYTFANAPTYSGMGFGPSEIVGRSILEVVGERIYAEIKPQIDRVLLGETATFEIERDFGGQRFYYQSTYVPELDADGKVVGFYVMSSDISQLKRTEQELMLLARFDGLTGLANRFHFNESADLALARHRRSGRPLALLYLDIDHFKRINDSLGHAAGDLVLAEFAQRLKGCLRVTDFAARLGGDEFVALIEDADTTDVPELIARKMIAAMQDPTDVGGTRLQVTASIGIAYCKRTAMSRDELLHIADETLYAAKAAGRNACRTAIVEEPGLKLHSGTF